MLSALPLEEPVFILSCVLTGLGVIFSIATLTFNLYHRHARLIKMSSPNLNAVINLGSLLAYTSCLLFGLGTVNVDGSTLVCQIRIWLLPVAFSLVFGPLFAKSWRVRRIFQQTAAKRVVIKDARLLLVVILFLVVDLIILTTWYLIDPVTSASVTRTIEVRDRESLYIMSSSTTTSPQCWSVYASVWTSGLAAIKVAILLYGLYLAWAIRGVSLPTMNEAPCIAGSSLAAVLLGSLLQALAFWLSHLPTAVSACAVLAIWFITTITLSLLYIPKIFHWWRNADDEVVKLSFAASQAMCSPNQHHDSSREEFFNLAAENRTYGTQISVRATKTVEQHTNDTELTQLNNNQDDQHKDSGIDVECSSGSQNEAANHWAGDSILPKIANADQYSTTANHFIEPYPSSVEYNDRAGNVAQYGALADDGRTGPAYAMRGTADTSRTDSWAMPLHYHPKTSRTSLPNNLPFTSNHYGNRFERNAHRRQHRFCTTKVNPCDSLSDIELEIDTPRSSFRERRPSRDSTGLRVLEYPARKHEIAGSIVQSFDLDDDSDTYSYISHRLSVPHNQRFFDNGGYTTDQESTLHASSDVSSSRESLSTIGNDSYYPQFAKLYAHNMRHKRRQMRRQYSHEPRSNLYFIQMPPPAMPHVPSSESGENCYGEDSTEV